MKIEWITENTGWNEFIAASDFGDILQTWEWGEINRDEVWTPHRLRVTEGQEVLGQALVLRRQLPLGFTLFYLPRGPVLDYISPQAEEILKRILAEIKELAASERGLMIKMGPRLNVEGVPGAKEMFARLGLAQSDRTVQMKYTRVIDLRPSEADILGSFDKDTRNLVRRAAKEGVVVDRFSEAADVKPLRTFHNMYLATATRGTFPARPWNRMVKLWELMAPLGMAHVYTASYEDEPLASSLVLQQGKHSYQLWSGSRRDVGKKFPTYALQWAIMQDMKQRGVETYDMWGTAPTDDDKDHPWAGPTHFKKGFNGARIEFIGDYDYPLSPAYKVFVLAERMRQRLFGQ